MVWLFSPKYLIYSLRYFSTYIDNGCSTTSYNLFGFMYVVLFSIYIPTFFTVCSILHPAEHIKQEYKLHEICTFHFTLYFAFDKTTVVGIHGSCTLFKGRMLDHYKIWICIYENKEQISSNCLVLFSLRFAVHKRGRSTC